VSYKRGSSMCGRANDARSRVAAKQSNVQEKKVEKEREGDQKQNLRGDLGDYRGSR